jgi:6-phosphogluconolactonase
MSLNRRHMFRLAAVSALMAAALPVLAGGDDADHEDHRMRAGKVFTSTNAAANNEVLVFDQTEEGALQLVARTATGGQGTGAGLGSQGAVTLSQDGRYLFVVNAQSNTVSTFALSGNAPRLTSVVPSGGLDPISVTEHEGLVYVLNAQGVGNVAGFRHVRGTLSPIAGAQGALSVVTGAAPAQVSFSSDGEALIVTEKGTNKLTSYRVKRDGTVGAPIVTASSGLTPFGFAVDRRDHIIVSEAAGGAAGASTVSSYKLGEDTLARPLLISASLPTAQTAACWVAVTPNGKFAYVTNAGSGNVSSFAVSPHSGKISLLQAAAGNLGAGSAPIDVAVSADGHHLFALGAGSLAITSFAVHSDGSLLQVGRAEGLLRGTVGLAAN